MATSLPLTSIPSGRIGLLADTHCRAPDGGDLPQAVLDALRGVDLILHLGDAGERGVLDRLAGLAPVLATRGGHDPESDPRQVRGARVLETGRGALGAVFDLGGLGIPVGEDGRPTPAPGTTLRILERALGRPVAVMAFAATHRPYCGAHDGVLFVNPGSATLPADPGPRGLGTLAIVDLRAEPHAEILQL
jgi:putative phosphoesterase